MIRSSSQELFKLRERVDYRDLFVITVLVVLWLGVEALLHYSNFIFPDGYYYLNLSPFRYGIYSLIDYKGMFSYSFFDVSKESGIYFSFMARTIEQNNLLALCFGPGFNVSLSSVLSGNSLSKETILIRAALFASRQFVTWFSSGESGFRGVGTI